MATFKGAAYKVLKKNGKPLHYREITKIALKEGLIETEGETPEATMNAYLSMDIRDNGDNAQFKRTDPGYYTLNSKRTEEVSYTMDTFLIRNRINESLTAREKGDIAEDRVAELITLYGKEEGLTCYKPKTDSEGIDLVVKRRGSLGVIYLQIKSSFGYKENGRLVSSIKDSNIIESDKMFFVFVYFDLIEGDLFENVFYIPASEFIKKANLNNDNRRVFTAGLKNLNRNKFVEFMIEKRELADKIMNSLE